MSHQIEGNQNVPPAQYDQQQHQNQDFGSYEDYRGQTAYDENGAGGATDYGNEGQTNYFDIGIQDGGGDDAFQSHQLADYDQVDYQQHDDGGQYYGDEAANGGAYGQEEMPIRTEDDYENEQVGDGQHQEEEGQDLMDPNEQVILMLQLIQSENPNIEYLDLSNKNITKLDAICEELVKFEDLKDLHLANNKFTKLPNQLNDYLFRIQNLNLNHIEFSDFETTIYKLSTLSELKSLYINLTEEDQVDYVMRNIEDIEFLNGLPLEKKVPTPSLTTPQAEDPENEEDIIQEASREEDEITSGSDDDIERAMEPVDDIHNTSYHRDPNPLDQNDSRFNYEQSPAAKQNGVYTDRGRSREPRSGRNAASREQSIESESEFTRGGFVENTDIFRADNVKQMISQKILEGIEDIYIDTMQSGQGINPNLISENFKNLNKNPMAMLRKTTLRSADPLQNAAAEFAQFENPTLEFIEDYRNVLDGHGVNEVDIRRIAAAFDELRQVRRQNPAMINQNNDRRMANYFEKNFKALLVQVKRLRNQQIRGIVNVEAKRGLLELISEKKGEYLAVTDPEIKKVDEFQYSMATKIIDESLNMYYSQVQSNDLFSALQESRQRAEEFEHKYKQELAINKQHVRAINQMKKKLLHMQEEQLVWQREKRINQRTKNKRKISKEKKKKVEDQPRSTRMQKVKNKKLALNGPLGNIPERVLTLRQLKDVIADIQVQKVKFDKKTQESQLPRQTMEQYMFTYLNQKYGLRPLIIEWSLSILNAITLYKSEDHQVRLFAKILKNDCDEEFIQVQEHVRETLDILLRSLLREKHPMKQETEINQMCNKIKQGEIQEVTWRAIVEKMYDFDDQNSIQTLIQNQIKYRQQYPIEKPAKGSNIESSVMGALAQKITGAAKQTKKISREEENALKIFLKQDHLLYRDFQKCILDFQLHEHETYLSQFQQIFKGLDSFRYGYLNEEQFLQALYIMNEICQDVPMDLYGNDVKLSNFYLVTSQNEADYLLHSIDPYHYNQITYSDTISLLSKHMVQSGLPGEFQSIPLLEKFHNICQDIGVEAVEMKIASFLNDQSFLQSQVDFQTFAGQQAQMYEQQTKSNKKRRTSPGRKKGGSPGKPKSLQAYLSTGKKGQAQEAESPAPQVPPEAHFAPPPPTVDVPMMTTENAPMPPLNAVLPPPLNPDVIKRNSIMVPPPPSIPQLQQILGQAIRSLYKSKIPAPPPMAANPPPVPVDKPLPSLTSASAPEAPSNIAKLPPLDPSIIKRNSIMVPPPQSIPQLQLLLGDAIRKLYTSKIPLPPKQAQNVPPVPAEKPAIPLTTVAAPAAPSSIVEPPPLDPAVLKRNSILVPPPATVPQLRDLLGDAVRKMYRAKIPQPPSNAPSLPVLPPQAPLPSLTLASAPPAPSTAAPPLDPAIAKRHSIMVPPPATMPQIRLKLQDAIRGLYRAKVPAPPQNAPQVPAPPVPAPTTLTQINAPAAPQGVVQPPPMDPAVLKRNSIMIPPPQTIPEMRLKLEDAIRNLYSQHVKGDTTGITQTSSALANQRNQSFGAKSALATSSAQGTVMNFYNSQGGFASDAGTEMGRLSRGPGGSQGSDVFLKGTPPDMPTTPNTQEVVSGGYNTNTHQNDYTFQANDQQYNTGQYHSSADQNNGYYGNYDENNQYNDYSQQQYDHNGHQQYDNQYGHGQYDQNQYYDGDNNQQQYNDGQNYQQDNYQNQEQYYQQQPEQQEQNQDQNYQGH